MPSVTFLFKVRIESVTILEDTNLQLFLGFRMLQNVHT
jgi:hypothetical protein